MAKRFIGTNIWDEDWFIAMPTPYKLFWFYMLSACDHAGVFKVNISPFISIHKLKIDPKKAFSLFNNGKERIRQINGSSWLIEDFFVFQYGEKFNPNNRVHTSIKAVYEKVGVKLGSIRGLIEGK